MPEVVMSVRTRDALLAAVALLGAVVAITLLVRVDPVRAAPADPPPDDGVLVDGLGSATGTPDVLRVTVGVETAADSVAGSLQEADAAAHRVLEALRGEDVPPDDVRTVDVSIYPRYADDGQRITGYTARHDLEVTLRDLEQAGSVIASVADAGGHAARVQGVSYALEDDAALQEEARAAAFADAREKAEQYARLTGRELGDVLELREEAPSAGPVPYAADSAAVAAEPVPLQPGTATVSVTAQVRWSLR
jgi:uncharacterized protein YggE